MKMRFLCLHGGGTSAAIFVSQTASFRSKLDPSFSFEFVNAPYRSAAAAGVETFYTGPYFVFWNEMAVEDIRKSHEWLVELLEKTGPYDGVIGFSQGCALISSFLMYHQVERPNVPLPFKVAIFICGGVPLPVVESLGVKVTEEARSWDSSSKIELQEKATAIANMKPGDDKWGRMKFTPSAAVDRSIVFGLNLLELPSNVRITIPTVHIYGRKDPRYPAGIQLAHFCEPALRKMYDHGSGHEIPRSEEVSNNIADLIKWSATVKNVRK